MVIKNKFYSKDIDYISQQIYIAIQKEKNLTKRPLEYIKKGLKIGIFYIALEKSDQVIGFIIKEKLISNYYEIKSWYIIPNKRYCGIGNRLINFALSDKNCYYLSVTFQSKMIDILGHYGFKQISLLYLPTNVLIRYLTTRNWFSILTHIFIKRSYLMIK
jgi:hypothetical protein